MNEIGRKEMGRRGKGLLALVLTFMMLFGSSLAVFAADDGTFTGTLVSNNNNTQGYSSTIQKSDASASGSEYESESVIPEGKLFVDEIIRLIKSAPLNSVLKIDFPAFNCFTDEIIEALAERPDLALQITFRDRSEGEAIVRTFTIPAGSGSNLLEQYPDQQFFGFLFFGSIYGWN